MKNQNGNRRWGYARINDHRSIPRSGSGDFDLHRQIGMGAPYELVDEPSDLRSYDLPAVLGNDDEIEDFMSKWDELEEMRYQRKLSEKYREEYQDDKFWLDFWRSFWRMFWMAFVMVILLYILLAFL